MKKISLVKDKNCKIDVNGVAALVNNASDSIQITVANEKFNFNEKIIVYPSTHKEYLKKLNVGSAIFIVITDKPYIDDFFYHSYDELIILSFYNWEYLTTLPKENGLLYWICDIMLAEFAEMADLEDHQNNTGCLRDFLGEKSGIDSGMKQARICAECLKKLARTKLTTTDKQLLNNVVTLSDILSKNSRWNKNILEGEVVMKIAAKKKSAKIAPVRKGEISVLIASPSDAIEERELLKTLDRQFRVAGLEEATGYRIITKGWEDLAPQNGYAQDIINNIILPEVDIIIGVLKHKMGTPTKNSDGSVRAESGTAEELYYAIEKNPEKVICMLYVNTSSLPISAQDPDLKNKIDNLNAVNAFIAKIKGKVMYQQFGNKNELLQLVMPHLAQNISRHFTTVRKKTKS